MAKIANKVAKKKDKYPELNVNFDNVVELNSDQKKLYFRKTLVNDIWGIGNRLSDFLSKYSINNALQFKEFDESFARKKRGIVLQRTIVELKGIACNEVENLLVKKKSICVSRSFGEKINDYEDIRSALIVYVQKASSKMRKHNQFCRSVTIFLKTSKYEKKYIKISKHTYY